MHSKNFFKQTGEIIDRIDCLIIEKMADSLANLRKKSGRLFFIGVGGGAGHASHAVNDFRKICEIECYSPIDNVSELTARTNDEGWDTVFSSWLETSKINEHDAVFVF
ncbi:MAG: sugar isomerase, partial [Pseudomonadota bacterium]|nr:sugar isomerase [Pseudomonadota bacterium]